MEDLKTEKIKKKNTTKYILNVDGMQRWCVNFSLKKEINT